VKAINATIALSLQKSQETQLMLTYRATRLEVGQGHQTWYHSIC